MSLPYVGEIRCFGFNFAPYQWAFCNGQILSIAQNAALFSIIGTYYGGNGTTTFSLPNLQGAIPMHWGTNPGSGLPPTAIGEPSGETQVTLTQSNLPPHTHTIYAATPGNASERTATPSSTAYLSDTKGGDAYQPPVATFNTSFSPKALSSIGGGAAHDNMQPYLVLNFCICLYGTFPTRN